MKVVLVHDDLVQWGGAERVLLGLCEVFPDAPIYTSVFDYNNFLLKQKFAKKKIITSFLQKIPGWRSLYKALLPLYPIAFEQFDFSGFDLVISNTTRFAKAVLTKPETIHICYCHTPPRFLWHFSDDKNYGLAEFLMNQLRRYDKVSANRVDFFLAGSKNAKQRIKKIYGKDSQVIYPFIDLGKFESVESFDGGYFVIAGRGANYKRFDLAIEATKQIGAELKIIDGSLSDELVLQILAGCRALIIPGIEDFGLISLEAQALGKPVIAFRSGGALETIIESKTGIFFDNQSIESLVDAIKKIGSINLDSEECIKNARRFSKENFKKNFRQMISSLVY